MTNVNKSLIKGEIRRGYTNVLIIDLKCPENVMKSTQRPISILLSMD
jgi:hypothetical protein